MRARIAAVAGVLAVAAIGCWVPPWEPSATNDLCDLSKSQPCLAGYDCVRNRCIKRLPTDAGNPCVGTPYSCGASECMSNACLTDTVCLAPRALTGAHCDGGVCRNDGVCVKAASEFNCADGVDNEGDGLIDCLDPQCVGVLCTDDQCSKSVCQPGGGCAGPSTTCGLPGPCHTFSGCDSVLGCQYSITPGAFCDDGDGCTIGDACNANGACAAGGQKVCNSAPNGCYMALGACASPFGTCSYTVSPNAPCDDSNPCTTGDSCQANGACSGGPQTGNACGTDAGICLSGTCAAFGYVPSNFTPAAALANGIGGHVVINCAATINTTTTPPTFSPWCGPMPQYTVLAQTNLPSAVVLAMTALSVDAGGTLTAIGDRPVIFAVWGNAAIDGTISVHTQRGGPLGAGANPVGTAGCPVPDIGNSGGQRGGGGGGGGFGTAGANGGTATGGPQNGGNGMTAQGTANLVPLRGGCPGADGGSPDSPQLPGGMGAAGGGAVQISAAGTLTIFGNGHITASGAGGDGGLQSGNGGGQGSGGGGGGSGGAILLEGRNISIATNATLTANGGGGGEGGDFNSANGDPGTEGSDSTAAVALGGNNAAAPNGGNGGNGGAGSTAPTSGQNVDNSGGGGGGGVGRIVINAGGGTCSATATVMSPPPTINVACP